MCIAVFFCSPHYLHEPAKHLDYDEIVELVDAAKIGHAQETDADATSYGTVRWEHES